MKFPNVCFSRWFDGQQHQPTAGTFAHVEADERERRTTTFTLHFSDEHGSGFCFPCDMAGNMAAPQNDCQAQNMAEAKARDWCEIEVMAWTVRDVFCPCGSGLTRRAQYDGRGIFLCYACPKCKAEKLAGYRPEILHTAYTQADVDEPIEPED